MLAINFTPTMFNFYCSLAHVRRRDAATPHIHLPNQTESEISFLSRPQLERRILLGWRNSDERGIWALWAKSSWALDGGEFVFGF